MVVQIQHRRDTAANWTSANPTLAAGEWGYETDTGKYKVGNGSSSWNAITTYVGVNGTITDYVTLMAAGCMVPVTTPATVDQAEIAAGATYANYVYIEFAKNASTTVGAQFIQWATCMPSDWNGGNLTAVIDWLTTGADTTNATKFILTARRYANATNLATALTTGVTTAEQASAGAGYLNLMTETAAFTVTGSGNWIVFSLTRVAPAGTDLNATVRVLGMKIKYIRTLA